MSNMNFETPTAKAVEASPQKNAARGETDSQSGQAIISVRGLMRTYATGRTSVHALNDVSITINRGEFVAIMGPSGSGKSTLLNVLGFLDKPDAGEYFLDGTDVSRMDDDHLSLVRNRYAGFVFQQFHLLARMSACENAELPLVYSGVKDRKNIALRHLSEVGLAPRAAHQPSELSGGEQQRVAIARALVNAPDIIFADEPTGNLDTKSEEEVMEIIQQLSRRGKTVVMVTHELEVAQYASRIIRMRDGKVVSDEFTQKKGQRAAGGKHGADIISADSYPEGEPAAHPHASIAQLKLHKLFTGAGTADYLRQAFSFMISHKMRTLLSMLGILIGVASVITMLAIGDGAKLSIESSLKSLGSNLLTIRPGAAQQGGARLEAGSVTKLKLEDSAAVSSLAGVARISPCVVSRAQLVYKNKNWNTRVTGAGVDYFKMHAISPVRGRAFSESEVISRRMVALIGPTVATNLFADKDPVGEQIRVNRILFTVIGVLPSRGASFMQDQDDIIVIPVTTAMYRVFGKSNIDNIEIEAQSESVISALSAGSLALLAKRHHLDPADEPFSVMDMSEIRKTMSSTTTTMSTLLGFVAAISLVVGGIGIMNIMLVSVKERTREIGLRKAIGARRRDILLQFLIEALLMTLSGGLLGLALGIVISSLIGLVTGWALLISPFSVALATIFSGAIGIAFGFWPAMLASKLRPVEALHYE